MAQGNTRLFHSQKAGKRHAASEFSAKLGETPQNATFIQGVDGASCANFPQVFQSRLAQLTFSAKFFPQKLNTSWEQELSTFAEDKEERTKLRIHRYT